MMIILVKHHCTIQKATLYITCQMSAIILFCTVETLFIERHQI